MSKIEHPNIIEQVAQIETDTKYLIVTEYATGGSLQNILKEGKDLKELDCVMIMKGILTALSYLHDNHITINELSSSIFIILFYFKRKYYVF